MRFAIISFPRCGTHMLGTSLNKHSEIYCATEIFNYNYIQRNNLFDFTVENIIDFAFKIGEKPNKGFLDHFYCYDAEDHDKWNMIKSKCDKIILLSRENLLRRYVSHRIALKTLKWASWSSEVHKDRIKLNIQDAFESIQKTEELIIKRKKTFREKEILELVYEDLELKYHDTMKAVQTFLGVKHEALKPKTYKQNTLPLNRLIINYNEVYDFFKKTPYRKFLDEIKMI